jgi:hypothetical protein
MRCTTEELPRVRPIPLEAFEVEVDEEPSMVIDHELDQWGTTIRILPSDTILEHYSDGAPTDEIVEVINFRQRR